MCIFTGPSRAAGCSAGLTVACSVNTYQPLIDQVFAGACRQCPDDAVSHEASVSIDDCKCKPGYYDDTPAAEQVSCEPCKAGTDGCPTNGTTTATLNISRGWYRSSASSDDLRRCPDGSRDNSGCIGGIGDRGPCKQCAAPPLHPKQHLERALAF